MNGLTEENDKLKAELKATQDVAFRNGQAAIDLIRQLDEALAEVALWKKNCTGKHGSQESCA